MGENLPTAGAEAGQDLMPEFTYSDLMGELVADFQAEQDRQPGDITIAEFAIRMNIGYTVAERFIKGQEKKGKIVRGPKVLINGRRSQVWRKA